MNLCRLTYFIKFNINRIIPKAPEMNLASIFQLSTLIRQLMVLVTHAVRNEEPTRKIKLSENFWFITEILSVTKDVAFLLSKFKNLTITVSFFYKRCHAW